MTLRALGLEVHRFAELGSTNARARRLAARSRPALVWAETQTAGRGRRARTWVSPAGGLWFSLLVYPSAPAPGRALVTLCAAKAVADALRARGIAARVRWPNDVVCGRRKVAGVLCERVGRALVAGFGVNVNQRSFPAGLAGATSLRRELGRLTELEPLLVSIAQRFLRSLAGPGFRRTIRRAEIERCLVLGPERLRARTVRGTVAGVPVGIDAAGRLLVHTAAGKTAALTLDRTRRVTWS